jgi:tape measure domain-containing protein
VARNINLGSINFGIAADTTRLANAISMIQQFGLDVNAAARQTGAGAAQIEAAFRRQEAAVISALRQVQRFQDQVTKAGAPSQFMAATTNSLNAFVRNMTSGQATALQFQRTMERFQTSMSNQGRLLNSWKEAQNNVGGLVNALREASSAAILFAGPLSGIAARLSVIAGLADRVSLSMVALISGMAAGAYAVYKLGSIAIDTEKKLQGIDQALTAVSGSSTLAAVQMKFLYDFAKQSGVAFDVLAKQYSQIAAAAKGTSLEGERTNDVFKTIVMVMAKLGKSSDDTSGALLAIQQMLSKGRISAEELRQQLGDRLPGALATFQKALGVTGPKLDQMLKKGEVPLSALTKFAAELRERFGIDLNEPITTLQASYGNLSTAITGFGEALNNTFGFADKYQRFIDYLTSSINALTDNMGMATTVLGAFAGALGAIAAPAILNGILALGRGLATLFGLFALFTPAGLIGGLLRLTTAIAGAVLGASLFSQVFGDSEKSVLKGLPSVQAYIEAQQRMGYTIRQTTQEYIKQQQAFLTGTSSKLVEAVDELQKLEEAQLKLKASQGIIAKFVQGVASLDDASFSESGAAQSVDAAKKRVAELSKAYQQAYGDLQKLFKIMDEQSARENKTRTDPEKDPTTRQLMAIKNAQDTIREAQRKANAMFQPDAIKDYLNVQNDISKAVENYRDVLTRAEVPAAKITELTNKYAEALKQVKMGELQLKTMTSTFQALSDIAGRAFDRMADSLATAFANSEDAMKALADTARFVAQDIYKTFLTLAVTNPLKNMLFGTNSPILSAGTAGAGGIFGSLFGGTSLANMYAPASGPVALGEAVSVFSDPWAGLVPGRASGGKVRAGGTYEVNEFGREFFTPDTPGYIGNGSGGGGNHFEAHIHLGDKGGNADSNTIGEIVRRMRAEFEDMMNSNLADQHRTGGMFGAKLGR